MRGRLYCVCLAYLCRCFQFYTAIYVYAGMSIDVEAWLQQPVWCPALSLPWPELPLHFVAPPRPAPFLDSAGAVFFSVS